MVFNVIGTAAIKTNNDEHAITLATGNRYKIKSIASSIIASGVANRYVQYTFEDSSGNVFFRVGNTTVITDTLTGVFSAGEGMENKALGNTVDVGQLPNEFIVPGGTVVKTVTENIAAGDRWQAMNILGEALRNL